MTESTTQVTKALGQLNKNKNKSTSKNKHANKSKSKKPGVCPHKKEKIRSVRWGRVAIASAGVLVVITTGSLLLPVLSTLGVALAARITPKTAKALMPK